MPYVCVGNGFEQRFPGMHLTDAIPAPDALIRVHLPTGDALHQEDRRLLYVAITRARDGIFFSLAEDYGGSRRKKPSSFMYELELLEPPVAAEKKPPLPVRAFIPTTKEKSETAAYVAREKHFSFTKLNTYNDCPWKYRYAFVLQIPKRGSQSLSYGSTMHTTLQNFFQLVKARQIDGEVLPSLHDLLTIYDSSFIDEWYSSKKQRQEYYDKGKIALTTWYERTVKSLPKVLKLEQVFNLKVDEFVINGAIDRIDEIGTDPTTKKPLLKIVDYKTGKVSEKFKKKDKYQLLIYTLAVRDPNILDGEVKELEYYFLDQNESRSMVPTEKDAVETLDWIRETVVKIQQGDFHPTPNKFLCDFCDYKDICEFRAL